MHPLGGKWKNSYNAEERRHLKAVMMPLRKIEPTKKIEPLRSKVTLPPPNTREAGCPSHNRLSKKLLMKHCYVEQPSDLTVANISGYQLTDVSVNDDLLSLSF